MGVDAPWDFSGCGSERGYGMQIEGVRKPFARKHLFDHSGRVLHGSTSSVFNRSSGTETLRQSGLMFTCSLESAH